MPHLGVHGLLRVNFSCVNLLVNRDFRIIQLRIKLFLLYVSCNITGLHAVLYVSYSVTVLACKLACVSGEVTGSTDNLQQHNCILFLLQDFLKGCVLFSATVSNEISPTRCNNCVFILRNGFTLHLSGDNLTHHQEYICCIWPQVSRFT